MVRFHNPAPPAVGSQSLPPRPTPFHNSAHLFQNSALRPFFPIFSQAPCFQPTAHSSRSSAQPKLLQPLCFLKLLHSLRKHRGWRLWKSPSQSSSGATSIGLFEPGAHLVRPAPPARQSASSASALRATPTGWGRDERSVPQPCAARRHATCCASRSISCTCDTAAVAAPSFSHPRTNRRDSSMRPYSSPLQGCRVSCLPLYDRSFRQEEEWPRRSSRRSC